MDLPASSVHYQRLHGDVEVHRQWRDFLAAHSSMQIPQDFGRVSAAGAGGPGVAREHSIFGSVFHRLRWYWTDAREVDSVQGGGG